MKFSLIHLLLLCFILLSEKKMFFSINIQYAYNFYGIDLNVCWGIFRTQSNIYGGAFLLKSQKRFIVDVRMGSKYISGIGFTVGRFIEVTIYLIQSVSTSNICHCVLASPINKTYFGLTKKVQFVLRFFVAADKLNTFRLE